MAGVTREAPAKLNLQLLVGPRREDGYHDIRSLTVALVGLSDTVRVARAAERSVRCAGLDGEANLAWAALDVLERRTGRALPCAVEIEKRIPTRAGLGGGSSDAAATLVATSGLFGLGLDAATLESLAADVGSDVPFFIRGGCQWVEGRGERLRPARTPAFDAVILKPPFGLTTGDVYRRFDGLPPRDPWPDDPPPPGMPELAGWVRNDLWDAARLLEPRLETSSNTMLAQGATIVLLCGSGSAVAGLFPDAAAARAAADALGAGAVVVRPGSAG